jgi:DNA-binding transcriptional LysR family regulator
MQDDGAVPFDVHLRDLRYFVTVAEEGSFTRAATQRLFVSQPALSKQIRQLESRMHAELFTRGARSVTLTAAGEALLPRAKALLGDWQAAVDEVAAAAVAAVRTVTVGLHARVAPTLLTAVETTVAERLPGWTVAFRQVPWEDPAVGLGGELVDVAIAWLPVADGTGLSAAVIATEERRVALPARHPLAGRAELTFADIADEPVIALPLGAGPMRDYWLAAELRTAPATVVKESHSAEETFDAVADGLGIVLVSASNAVAYERPDVVHRRVTDLPPSRLAVLWRSADRRQGVRTVIDACVRHGGA